MRTARHTPVTLEQAVLRCDICGEDLAIVESLGDQICTVYLWKPPKDEDGQDEMSPCHGRGVTEWQAVAAYQRDGCDQYWQATITDYTWPDRDEPPPTVEDLGPEPMLAPDPIEQLALLEQEA